jgi:protein-S-isoprenylcysteine O-methyltransferase Ste14
MIAAPEQDSPGVIARPPLLFLAALALGLALHYAWPVGLWSGPGRVIAGVVVLALGSALLFTCVNRFRSAGTNVQTSQPTTALVTSGPYRYSRNPIYIALSAIYLAIALLVDSAAVAVLLVPVLLLVRYGVIAREEAYLERKFGEDYRRYTQTARRWL